MSASGALDVDVEVRRDAFVLRARLQVAPGERVGVIGPNGSGKSTLLRAIAGLVPVSAGGITLGERVLTTAGDGVPAEQRRVALLFQDYRLFPHLSVRDNVAFAPRAAGVGRREARARAESWLRRLDVATLADRRPSQLSGGQAQRVALARALAQEPDALLLDEPMAALDAGARMSLRTELRAYLAEVAQPTVLVTHDPVEALVMTDRLIVLEDGRIVQEGEPADVTRRPGTAYVARLMGLNLYAGAVEDGAVRLSDGGRWFAAGATPGSRVLVAVRPSAITVHRGPPEEGSSRNVWPGTVAHLELLGDRVRLQVDGAPSAMVDVTTAAVADLGLAPGASVWLTAKATESEVYPDEASFSAER